MAAAARISLLLTFVFPSTNAVLHGSDRANPAENRLRTGAVSSSSPKMLLVLPVLCLIAVRLTNI
jgi:hypothetical protein